MRFSLAWNWEKLRNFATLLLFQRFVALVVWYMLCTSYVRICLHTSKCLRAWVLLVLVGCVYFDPLQGSFSYSSSYFLVSQSLLPDYQRLLSSMPSRRLNTSKLIENSGEFPLLWIFCSFATVLEIQSSSLLYKHEVFLQFFDQLNLIIYLWIGMNCSLFMKFLFIVITFFIGRFNLELSVSFMLLFSFSEVSLWTQCHLIYFLCIIFSAYVSATIAFVSKFLVLCNFTCAKTTF